MRRPGRRALVTAAALLSASLPARAWAYRPFDQTDAAVAERNEFELELGPFAAVHGRERAPRTRRASSSTTASRAGRSWSSRIPRSFLSARRRCRGTRRPNRRVLVKSVLREGGLQDQAGPSVALEVGALLPSLPHPDGWGATSTLIVSCRWPATTIHAATSRSPTRAITDLDMIGGVIIELPHTWRIRPVAETFFKRAGPDVTVVSGLAGAIWTLRETFTLDAAVRAARDAGAAVTEVRLGFTWTFAP